MKITIIYDNCMSKTGLKTGRGFSSLIEVDGAPPLLSPATVVVSFAAAGQMGIYQ
jgi:metal-dependent hydrolase (beta-lactamase superfamily II)